MQTLKLKSIKTNGFKIELTVNAKNQPVARVYKQITSGKNKGTEKQLEGFYFTSDEKRTEWITKRINTIVANANAKAAAAEKLKEAASKMNHNYVVGSILYDSWGYEQTNVNFYQVIEVKAKSVVIREIAAKSVKQTSADSGRCKPVANEFVGEPMVKKISVNVYLDKVTFNINSPFRGWLGMYDGGEEGVYYSWGY